MEELRDRYARRVVRSRFRQNLWDGIASTLHGVARLFDDMSETEAVAQLDAHSQYRALTNVDLGRALGCPGHFEGVCRMEEVTSEVSEDDDDLL